MITSEMLLASDIRLRVKVSTKKKKELINVKTFHGGQSKNFL